MKKLILDIMYNLYMLNIIRMNKHLKEYMEEMKKRHDEEMVQKIKSSILNEI